LRVDLLGISMVVEKASFDLSLGKLRQRLLECPRVLAAHLIVSDDLPDAETGARDLGLAPGGFIGEVNSGTLSHPQGLLQEVLGHLGEGAPGAFGDPSDLGLEMCPEP
jgi:hypothetical protein